MANVIDSVAVIVFAVGMFFDMAQRQREAQYQRVQAEKAEMDAERARAIAEVNREVMERLLREKLMEEREGSDGSVGQ